MMNSTRNRSALFFPSKGWYITNQDKSSLAFFREKLSSPNSLDAQSIQDCRSRAKELYECLTCALNYFKTINIDGEKTKEYREFIAKTTIAHLNLAKFLSHEGDNWESGAMRSIFDIFYKNTAQFFENVHTFNQKSNKPAVLVEA